MFPSEPPYPMRPEPRPAVASRWAQTLSLFLIIVMLVGIAVLFLAPSLMVRWRAAEAQVAYLNRQAELKAESEAADARLAALDSKIKLIALGFRDVAKKVTPAVVNVSNERAIPRDAAGQMRGQNLFYDNDKGRVYVEVSVGSGIIVKPGLVLTNNHVVKGAERLRVTFASGNWVAVNLDRDSEGTSHRALATDPVTDLAVIRLPDSKIMKEYEVTASFADSDKVQVGDWAIAVGSPLGLEQSVTHGIISAKGRSLSNLDMVEVLQTDAPINPGNSGGPLFDQLGRVVGINVAIATKTGGNQGIGFAIPSNTAKDIFTQLAEQGEVVRGYLGVALRELSPAEGKRFGAGDTGAVLIQQVTPRSAAARAPPGGGHYRRLRGQAAPTEPGLETATQNDRRQQTGSGRADANCA